jgi:small subunit ribosomal protein S16
MAVRIRLARYGAKKRPFYRIVAADSESRRDGRFIETIGTYNPCVNPPKIDLKLDRYEHWTGQGAKPTETVASIVRKARKQVPAEV